MSRERGSTLVGTLAIGFLFVLVIAQAALTIGRLSSASSEAAEVATSAAQHGARHSGPEGAVVLARGLLPEADVSATATAETLEVVVLVDVPLIGPEGSPVRTTVTGRAAAPISPYRSRP